VEILRMRLTSYLRLRGPAMARPSGAWARRRRTWLAVAVSLAALAAALLWARRPARPRWTSVPEFERWYARQHPSSLNMPAWAPVTIVEFADYQCRPCRMAYADIEDVARRVRGVDPSALAQVTRDYPLERECNGDMVGDLHPLACDAAVAVRLAGRAGHDGEMKRWLFEHQPELSRRSIVDAAHTVGAVGGFEAEAPAAMEEIKRDVDLARRLRVAGTPVVFVNGVRLGFVAKRYLEAAVALELDRTGRSAAAAALRSSTSEADLGRAGASAPGRRVPDER